MFSADLEESTLIKTGNEPVPAGASSPEEKKKFSLLSLLIVSAVLVATGVVLVVLSVSSGKYSALSSGFFIFSPPNNFSPFPILRGSTVFTFPTSIHTIGGMCALDSTGVMYALQNTGGGGRSTVSTIAITATIQKLSAGASPTTMLGSVLFATVYSLSTMPSGASNYANALACDTTNRNFFVGDKAGRVFRVNSNGASQQLSFTSNGKAFGSAISTASDIRSLAVNINFYGVRTLYVADIDGVKACTATFNTATSYSCYKLFTPLPNRHGNRVEAMLVDVVKRRLFVSDRNNMVVQVFDLNKDAGGAGQSLPAANTFFKGEGCDKMPNVRGFAIDSSRNILLMADRTRIRAVDLNAVNPLTMSTCLRTGSVQRQHTVYSKTLFACGSFDYCDFPKGIVLNTINSVPTMFWINSENLDYTCEKNGVCGLRVLSYPYTQTASNFWNWINQATFSDPSVDDFSS